MGIKTFLFLKGDKTPDAAGEVVIESAGDKADEVVIKHKDKADERGYLQNFGGEVNPENNFAKTTQVAAAAVRSL